MIGHVNNGMMYLFIIENHFFDQLSTLSLASTYISFDTVVPFKFDSILLTDDYTKTICG